MKILLLSANKLKEPYPVYPLGIDYVAGAISSGHNLKILDMNNFDDNDALGAAIKENPADIIGISLRNIDNTDAKNLKYFLTNYQNIIDTIRKNSSGLIILGGSAFTIFPSEFMDALNADYGIIGEGERFQLFLDALQSGKTPSEIPGVIKKNTPSSIPEPWNNTINRKFIKDNSNVDFYLNKGGMLNLQTKRGCSFKCIYCTYPHIEGSNLRLFAPEEIAKSALELQNAGAKYLFITDSAFNCSYPHSMETVKAFIKAGLSIPWGAFFAPTRPPDDYYRVLADAGLKHAEFGTESLSNEMLKNYRKPFTVTEVLASHGIALKAGIHTAHYLLFGGPGESSATVQETLTNSEKLTKTVFFVFCGMRIFPHTELFNIAKNENQITESQSLLEPLFYNPASINIENIAEIINRFADTKTNWIIGSGGRKAARLMRRMYNQGHTGPLWEHLIQ